ncbi:MAG: prepilin peptidase [Deltaproteobacteria bacterium]|nr:prepilin peptidase [Deltaproteobacteria bacterium]
MHIPKILLLIQAGIFGLILGSFLNVLIYRLPQSMSILGRSYCPHCRAQIPFYRNVPLVSYLLQWGKSACCQKKISPQYPLIEALTGFVSVVTVMHAETLPQYFIWFLLFMCPLIVISVIDFQLKIIPDVISVPFIIVGLMVQQFEHYPEWWAGLKFSGLGLLIGGGFLLLFAEVMSRLLKKEAMGGGDIKLMAMLGAFLGPKSLIFIYIAGSMLALVYAVFGRILNKHQDRQIPFGPFLSMAGMLFWFYREQIIERINPVIDFYAGVFFS